MRYKNNKFQQISNQEDVQMICQKFIIFISQTKSSLDKIFYKIVYHHIIYMCDFLCEFRRLFYHGLHGFSRSCGLHQICPHLNYPHLPLQKKLDPIQFRSLENLSLYSSTGYIYPNYPACSKWDMFSSRPKGIREESTASIQFQGENPNKFGMLQNELCTRNMCAHACHWHHHTAWRTRTFTSCCLV